MKVRIRVYIPAVGKTVHEAEAETNDLNELVRQLRVEYGNWSEITIVVLTDAARERI